MSLQEKNKIKSHLNLQLKIVLGVYLASLYKIPLYCYFIDQKILIRWWLSSLTKQEQWFPRFIHVIIGAPSLPYHFSVLKIQRTGWNQDQKWKSFHLTLAFKNVRCLNTWKKLFKTVVIVGVVEDFLIMHNIAWMKHLPLGDNFLHTRTKHRNSAFFLKP